MFRVFMRTAGCAMGWSFALLPLGWSQAEPDRRAIAEIDEIEATIESIRAQDVRDRLPVEKVDLPEEVRSSRQGEVNAGESVEVFTLNHWTEDNSPYGIEWSGSGIVRLQLPKLEEEEKRGDAKVGFVTFSIRPALSEIPGELTIISIGGATMAFTLEEPTMGIRAGKTFVLNGDPKRAIVSDWVDTGITYPVNESFEAAMTLDYMIRWDENAREWDLFQFQQLRYAGVRFSKSTDGIWAKSAGSGKSVLAELRSTSYNPLFADEDLDGIDDKVEIELGFSADLNDRHETDEMGVFTNVQHFVNRRMTYTSRRENDIEDLVTEAIVLKEAGVSDTELEARAIKDEERTVSFTEEEYRQRDLVGARAINDNLRKAGKSQGEIGGRE